MGGEIPSLCERGGGNVRSNEDGITFDMQSAIALYIAGKIFAKVKESDSEETINDFCTCILAWGEGKPAYRNLSSKEMEYVLEGKIEKMIYENFFGCKFTIHAHVTKLGKDDEYPDEPDYSIMISITLGGEKIW